MEAKADALEIVLARIFAVFKGVGFRRLVERFVRRHYARGMTAEEITLKLRTNAIPDEDKVSLITDETHTELSSLMDDLEKQYQQTIRESVRNNESPELIKKRLKTLMNPSGEVTHNYPSGRKMNWRDRLDMIQRTESNKAQNQGRLDTFKQSGLVGKKYLSVHEDERTSGICQHMDGKYGKEELAIPADQPFEVMVPKVGLVSAQSPPFHPNCRTRIMFALPEE